MKHYNAIINEFPAIFLADFCEVQNTLYFRQNKNVRKIGGVNSNVIFNMENLDCITSNVNGIWCVNDEKSIYLDLFEFNKNVEKTISLSEAAFYGDEYVTCDDFSDTSQIVYSNMLSESKSYGLCCHYVNMDKRFIYTKSMLDDTLRCFDKKINEIWSVNLTKDFFSLTVNKDIMLTDNLVLINHGLNEITHDDFEIIAFNKETANVEWTKVMKSTPAFSRLIDSKYYIFDKYVLTILDASTGEEKFCIHSGFENNIPNGCHESVTVFACNKSIYIFDMWNHAIRIFNHDMKFQQEIILPEPETNHCLGYFQPNISTNIIEKDGSIYCFLSYYTGLGAVLILNPSESDKPKITIKKRPDFQLENIETSTLGHGYKLSIDSNDLDEVITSGEYELMEMCQYLGLDRSNHDHFDPDLNEHIIYSVNVSTLPQSAEKQLKKMIVVVEEFFTTFEITAPKTGKYFKVKLELRRD